MSLKLSEIFPSVIRGIRNIERDVIRTGGRPAAELMKEDIVKSIERGNSPVDGEGRFEKYSSSYINAIKKGRIPSKRARPVNLKVTGELLKSIASKITSTGFKIFFRKKVNGKDLAGIHSFEGAGKSKTIRMIMPDKDGDYKRSVKLRADKLLIKVTNDVLVRHLRRFK